MKAVKLSEIRGEFAPVSQDARKVGSSNNVTSPRPTGMAVSPRSSSGLTIETAVDDWTTVQTKSGNKKISDITSGNGPLRSGGISPRPGGTPRSTAPRQGQQSSSLSTSSSGNRFGGNSTGIQRQNSQDSDLGSGKANRDRAFAPQFGRELPQSRGGNARQQGTSSLSRQSQGSGTSGRATVASIVAVDEITDVNLDQVSLQSSALSEEIDLDSTQKLRVKAAIKEYLINDLLEELVEVFRELGVLGSMKHVTRATIHMLVDIGHHSDQRIKVFKIITFLSTPDSSGVSLLTQTSLISGLLLFLMQDLEEISVDAPNAVRNSKFKASTFCNFLCPCQVKYLGSLIAFLLKGNILQVAFLAELTVTQCSKKSDIVAHTFTELAGKELLGEEAARELFMSSGINIIDSLQEEFLAYGIEEKV